MGNAASCEPVVRFHDFQVNLETGEVWKNGIRLKLQDQPFTVLVTLVQRPGQVVPREELHQLIWPQETFGDFDHAINLAINKLRATLGDSADVPHLIETLPRRGYRFIAPVEAVPSQKPKPIQTTVNRLLPHWLLRFVDTIRKYRWAAAATAAVLLFAILSSYVTRHFSLTPSSLPVTRSIIRLEPDHMLDGVRAVPPYGIGQPVEAAVAISICARVNICPSLHGVCTGRNPGGYDHTRSIKGRIEP
jgi:DNA-binding winged helix-turn-helix (wHTH) protein